METPETQTTEEILIVTQTSTNAATHVSNAISPGSIRGVSAGIAGKIFTNIKFLNITYSDELENAIQNWKSDILPFDLGIEIPTSIESNIIAQHIPYDFAKRDTPANFLLNYWDDLIFFLLVISVYVLIWTLNWIAVKIQTKYFPVSIIGKLKIMTQNYLLNQLFTTYGDIIFFGVLELRILQLDSGISIFSFIMILSLILLIIISFGVYFKILLKYQKIKAESIALEHFTKHYQGFQLFYNDFKDSSIFHQSVLFVMVIKDILFSLIITTLFEYPLVQALLTLMLSLLMVAYYLIKRPFKNTFEAAQQVIYEIIILIVTINIMILAVLDDDNSMDVTARNSISKVIIVLNFCFNFLAFLFLLAKIGEVLLDAYKNYRSRRKVQVEKLKPNSYIDSTVPNLVDPNNDTSVLDSSQTKIINAFTSNRMSSIHNENIISFTNFRSNNPPGEAFKTLQRPFRDQNINLQQDSYRYKNKRIPIYPYNQTENHIPFHPTKQPSIKPKRKNLRPTNSEIDT